MVEGKRYLTCQLQYRPGASEITLLPGFYVGGSERICQLNEQLVGSAAYRDCR